MIRITIKEGKYEQTLTVAGDKVSVGRLPANTVQLSDRSVSRKHCMIRRQPDGGLEVLDLNSRHGTRVNGKTIDRARLGEGDRLELGEVVVRIDGETGIAGPASLPSGAEATRPAGKPAEPGETPDRPAREGKILLSDSNRTTFSSELYLQLSRTPWWAASAALHFAFIYVLLFVPFEPARETTPFGTFDGHFEDFASLLENQETPDLEIERPTTDPIPPPAMAEIDPLPFQAELPPLPPEADPLPEIGPASLDLSVPGSKGLESSVQVPETEFGKAGADGANRHAVALLQKSLAGPGGGGLGLLRRLPPEDILVAKGSYDHVESILDMLGLPHQQTSMEKLEKAKLTGRRILIINCSNEALSPSTAKKIREFVREGGYLLTTDWGVESVIEPSFPGTLRPVRRGGRNLITPDEVIRINAVAETRRHFLMKGIALEEGAKWWLEESSYPFEVLPGKDVEVLIESEELGRYRTRAVAATFRYGEGRVLHMLGHFYQREGDLKGTFSTQRLIANFLLAAVRGK